MKNKYSDIQGNSDLAQLLGNVEMNSDIEVMIYMFDGLICMRMITGETQKPRHSKI